MFIYQLLPYSPQVEHRPAQTAESDYRYSRVAWTYIMEIYDCLKYEWGDIQYYTEYRKLSFIDLETIYIYIYIYIDIIIP